MAHDVFAGGRRRNVSRRFAVRRLAGVAMVAAAGIERLPAGMAGASPSVRPVGGHERKGMGMNESTPGSAEFPLTVVLVHGAFADASGWAGVITRLQDAGIAVTASVNPLRSVVHDAGYIASLLRQIPGPVLLVGHSYGGVVITNAAAAVENVLGLVYVAGFAPDEGESLMDIEEDSKDSVLNSSLIPLQYPTGDGAGTAIEFVIDPEKYHEAFAADLPVEQTRVMAAYQRPAAALAFSETSGAPAWASLPSWAVIPTGDKAAGADVLRVMAERAGANIVEVEGSHAIMVSQPQAVTEVLLTAAKAVSRSQSTIG